MAGDIGAFAEQLVAATGDASWRALAGALRNAADTAAFDAAAAQWQAALLQDPTAFARVALGVDLIPELTALVAGELASLVRSDPRATSGMRRTLPLGPVELTVDAAPFLYPAPGGGQRQLGYDGIAGLGVDLDAGFLSGFGTGMRDGNRYLASAGARLGPVRIAVFVVIESADGAPSVVALLGAHFAPGFQLGLGF